MSYENQFFGSRLAFARLLVLLSFLVIITRLWYLQVIYGAFYRDQSENNRTRIVRMLAPRGTIYDREHKILAGNRLTFDIELIMEDVPNVEQTLHLLSEITGRDLAVLQKQLETQKSRHHFEPKVIISDASWEELAKVKARSWELPGVVVDVFPARYYPNNSLAVQVLGYAREIDREQLEILRASGESYRQGDFIGKAGLEKSYEKTLRGQSGELLVEVDAMGNRKKELGKRQDIPGKDLQLTIDLDLQSIAEEALASKKGAIVVMDPNNGEVLALASAPTYDGNIFSRRMQSDDWGQIGSNRAQPLNNRAISQVYPAGSTFKLVTSVAGLNEHELTEDTVYNCPGYYFFANRRWQCHKKTGHGGLNIERALAVSCNSFYFRLGQALGISKIEHYAKMLGLGAVTGIDLPNEVPGIVPSEEWKRKLHGQKWYPGDTLPVSIGQGYIVVSPIQMAVMVSAIANGGTIYKPHVVSKVIDSTTGNVETEMTPTIVRQADVAAETFKIVRKLAAGVVNDDHGTGKAARIEGITVAGKTGTAQVSALGRENLSEALKDHAWFVSFAPVDHPLIASAIIVENGGHGGATSAPIAKKLYEKFFRKKGLLAPEPAADKKEEDVDPDVEEGFSGTSSASDLTTTTNQGD